MEIIVLKEKAKELRKDIVEMIYRAKSGHPGGSLSIADIMAVLYWSEMREILKILKTKKETDLY